VPNKKKKSKIYFGLDVQDAIVRYNLSESESERNKIYQEEIHYAFDKLCENIINTFKFTYFNDPFEDVKQEVISFLVMNMHKYDHTKGSKAFSYFSVVAKNYLILHNNSNYKKMKVQDDISILNTKRVGEENDYSEFVEEVVQYFDKNIPTIFRKKRDIDIAYSIVELFKNRESIENFNKKSLYILIREMTDVNTTHITAVVNVFKKHYEIILNNYYKSGNVEIKKNNKFF